MNIKRFLFRCINFLISCCSVLFLTFIGFCITLVFSALLDPSGEHINLSIIIVFLTIVPAVILTKKLAKYCRKKQVPHQPEPPTPIAEETIHQDTAAEIFEHDPDPEPNPDSVPEPASQPEPKKECDPADDIPDIVQKEYFSDTLFLDAVEVTLESRIVSAGRLQSALKIGSNRASRILKEMEELGVIGPERGNRPREVFFTPEEWKTERKRFVWFPDSPDDPANPPTPKKEPTPKKSIEDPIDAIYKPQATNISLNCRCRRCGGSHISFDTVSESKPAGCLTVLWWLFLAMTVFGILILIVMWLTPRKRTVTYATCQNCGMRWRTS